MAKEKVYIQIGNEIIELKGDELKAFEEERQNSYDAYLLRKENEKVQRELKISAYKKLGLTDEEIAAII